MYLEFLKFSNMSMANSSLSDSNQLSSVCSNSSIPTMEFSASRKEMDEKKQEDQESEANNQRVSYSSCSSSSSFMSLQVEQEVATKHIDHNHEDDTGYQTPTSPRHRIPPTLKCPPAPKKPPATLRAKRKTRRGPLARHDQIKVLLIDQELVDFEPRRKKARRDTTIG